jgi:putative ubiquitin-RnfH superfamily antitoxin RatB of RatAB toxin-antitoxin module
MAPLRHSLRVTVIYSPAPREVLEWPVELATGASVADAFQASGLRTHLLARDLQTVDAGVWGRKARLDQLLRDGDRVEVYRPLQVDPKVARRERFRKQGARAPGLFAGKRAGAKPGY